MFIFTINLLVFCISLTYSPHKIDAIYIVLLQIFIFIIFPIYVIFRRITFTKFILREIRNFWEEIVTIYSFFEQMEKFSPVIFYTLPYKICQMYNCIYVMCAKNSALSYQIDVPHRIKVNFILLWQVDHFLLWGFFKFIATKEPNSGNFRQIFSPNNCFEKMYA